MQKLTAIPEATKRGVERDEMRHLQSVPYARFQYVDVTFPSTANIDTVVEHQLETTDPELVTYTVVKADRATSIYNDQSSSRKAWLPGTIILRSSVANAVVKLLLTIPSSQ